MNSSSLLHPSQRSSSPAAQVIFRKLLKPLVDSHFSAPVSCLTRCLSSCAIPSSKQEEGLDLNCGSSHVLQTPEADVRNQKFSHVLQTPEAHAQMELWSSLSV
jgi:hypothetical protein